VSLQMGYDTEVMPPPVVPLPAETVGRPPTTEAEPGAAKGSMSGEFKKFESDGTTASTGVAGVYIDVAGLVLLDSVPAIDPDDMMVPGVGEVFLVCLGRRGSGA
jgi:hypothetical protein